MKLHSHRGSLCDAATKETMVPGVFACGGGGWPLLRGLSRCLSRPS
jgi:hypothetical protein